MLAIARGLMARPQVLMLDEPSLGLAPKLLENLYDLLAALRDEEPRSCSSTRWRNLALSVADRAYVLQSGAFTHSGTAREVAQDPALVKALSRRPRAAVVSRGTAGEGTMDLILRNARRVGAEQELTDIGIAGGKIGAIEPRLAAEGEVRSISAAAWFRRALSKRTFISTSPASWIGVEVGERATSTEAYRGGRQGQGRVHARRRAYARDPHPGKSDPARHDPHAHASGSRSGRRPAQPRRRLAADQGICLGDRSADLRFSAGGAAQQSWHR